MSILFKKLSRVSGCCFLIGFSLFVASCSSPGPGVGDGSSTAPAGRPVAPRGEHDAFVVLSGGGTPLSNNYSQYLQARALNDWLRERYLSHRGIII